MARAKSISTRAKSISNKDLLNDKIDGINLAWFNEF